jgi:hypothetical protein
VQSTLAVKRKYYVVLCHCNDSLFSRCVLAGQLPSPLSHLYLQLRSRALRSSDAGPPGGGLSDSETRRRGPPSPKGTRCRRTWSRSHPEVVPVARFKLELSTQLSFIVPPFCLSLCSSKLMHGTAILNYSVLPSGLFVHDNSFGRQTYVR